jgi:hypothetical protein
LGAYGCVEEITLPPLDAKGAEFFIWMDAIDDLLDHGETGTLFLRSRSDILEMYPESKKDTNEIDEIAPRNWYIRLLPETETDPREFVKSRGVQLLRSSVDTQIKQGGGYNQEKFWWWVLKAQRQEPTEDVVKIPVQLSPSPLAHKNDGKGIWWLVSLTPASPYESEVMSKVCLMADPDWE